jgi:hypothetical protein
MLKSKTIDLGPYQSFRFPKESVLGSWGFLWIQMDGLLRYLNEGKTPEQRRALSILEKMIQLANIEPPIFNERIDGPVMVRGLPNPAYRKVAPEKYRRQMQIEELKAHLNAELSRYKFIPFVLMGSGSDCLSVVWHRDWRIEMEEPKKPPEKLLEGQYLEMLLNLARSRLLKRLRHCNHCGNWLYAKFRHQEFCSTKCQQKHYTQSEDWKAHRREYMRGYYQRTYARRKEQ